MYMNKRILITAIYPAPYRVELINILQCNFDADVFFDYSSGDERNDKWFIKGNYYLLDTKEGKERYRESIFHLKRYSLVIIYDYTTKNSIFLISLCKLTHTPYIINADGIMITGHGSFLREVAKKYLIGGAASYFASGANAKHYFMKYGANAERIYIHHFSTLHSSDILDSPISSQYAMMLREKLGISKCTRLALAVGRFIPLKRYDCLIREWKNMPKEYHLLLVGGGKEEDNYNNIIRDNRITNVTIEGFHTKEELIQYYQAADVFVHPTSYDVWGLVINEAMSNGLPVVVSNHCVAGLELVQQGENGFQFELDNYFAMKKFILQIFEDDELRCTMKEKALSSIRDYTVENMAESQVNAIKRIIRDGKSNDKRG